MMNEEIEKKDEGRFSYEPEADIATWELSHEAAIDSAREVGNVIVHFTPQNVPVLIEILNANQFLRSAGKVFDQTPGPALGPEAAGV
jgi:hypothetical protein